MTEADLDRALEVRRQGSFDAFDAWLSLHANDLITLARRGLEVEALLESERHDALLEIDRLCSQVNAARQERDRLRERLATGIAAHSAEVDAHERTLQLLNDARELVGKMLGEIKEFNILMPGGRWCCEECECSPSHSPECKRGALLAQARAVKSLTMALEENP